MNLGHVDTLVPAPGPAPQASVPRRAILVGSLDWPPKRLAVESFLEVSAILLADAGVQLQLVGEVDG